MNGRVALVTGASRGVGAATAVVLAEQGYAVACAARSTSDNPHRTPGTVDDTVARIEGWGGRALAVPTDLADPDAVVAMVATTVERLGRLDVLVNNAAITFPGDLDLAPRRFDLVFAVDTRAPFLAIQAAVPHLPEGGAIVNVSSLAALNYFPGLMAYGMAKAALEHLTVAAAAQLRPLRIAVNTFRIDVPVASEGFTANAPGLDQSDWEPPAVAAEGISWMVRQPPEWTGHNVGMAALRDRHGIMASRVARPHHPGGDLVTETHLRPPG